MAVGNCIITSSGVEKFSHTGTTGASLVPTFYRVTGEDIPLDPDITTFAGWREAPISAYLPIAPHITEFCIDIPLEETVQYGTTFGLFLEDNTLFALAKPPYPLPPGLRHIFKIQLVYENITNMLDFVYLPFDETEQDLSLMNAVLHFTEEVQENTRQMALLQSKVLGFDNRFFSLHRTIKNLEKFTFVHTGLTREIIKKHDPVFLNIEGIFRAKEEPVFQPVTHTVQIHNKDFCWFPDGTFLLVSDLAYQNRFLFLTGNTRENSFLQETYIDINMDLPSLCPLPNNRFLLAYKDPAENTYTIQNGSFSGGVPVLGGKITIPLNTGDPAFALVHITESVFCFAYRAENNHIYLRPGRADPDPAWITDPVEIVTDESNESIILHRNNQDIVLIYNHSTYSPVFSSNTYCTIIRLNSEYIPEVILQDILITENSYITGRQSLFALPGNRFFFINQFSYSSGKRQMKLIEYSQQGLTTLFETFLPDRGFGRLAGSKASICFVHGTVFALFCDNLLQLFTYDADTVVFDSAYVLYETDYNDPLHLFSATRGIVSLLYLNNRRDLITLTRFKIPFFSGLARHNAGKQEQLEVTLKGMHRYTCPDSYIPFVFNRTSGTLEPVYTYVNNENLIVARSETENHLYIIGYRGML